MVERDGEDDSSELRDIIRVTYEQQGLGVASSEEEIEGYRC